jgi:hypothetical protein
MSTTMRAGVGFGSGVTPRTDDGTLDSTATAFGISAAVAIVFNTLLAWVKDAYEPLNTLMAQVGGHHWTTHGLADVIVFLALGAVLTRRGITMDGNRIACLVAAAVVLSGAGLGLWFLLV